MDWPPIVKDLSLIPVQPNLTDYQQACAGFSWESVRNHLDGLPAGRGLNIAHEAVDRHAEGPLKSKVALRWLGKNEERIDISYSELKDQSNRFANILNSLEIMKGERVFSLCGRIPELYFAALGTLKNTSVLPLVISISTFCSLLILHVFRI